MHIIAAKAVAFKEALQPSFKDYAQLVLDNAQALAKGLTDRGLQPGLRRHGQPPDAGGSAQQGHLRPGVRGTDGQRQHHLQQELHPYDTAGANHPNGIRLGTAAVAARGLQPADMDTIAHCIDLLVSKREAGVKEARALVAEITVKYPLYR